MNAADPSGEGGASRHVPVLLAEVLTYLNPRPDAHLVDGTFGAGGYTQALLDAGSRVLALDRDPRAVAAGRALEARSDERLTLSHARFSDLDAVCDALEFSPVAGVVLDIGVSSMQLDEAARGFSFLRDGPLDMRMSSDGPSAADVVNAMSWRDLARVIGLLGEERQAGRIARAIEARRRGASITRTGELADLIEATVGRPPGQRIHPATRTFQALRAFVNRELEELAQGLAGAEAVLETGGRLVVVTFHSLEDRIVKRFFQDRARINQGSRHMPQIEALEPSFEILTRKPVEPGEAEVERNPRARSARLRAGRRLSGPARALDMAALGVPSLPGPEAFAF